MLISLILLTLLPTPSATAPSATAAHGIVAAGDFQGFSGDQGFADDTAGRG
jgi:hypothetical protein